MQVEECVTKLIERHMVLLSKHRYQYRYVHHTTHIVAWSVSVKSHTLKCNLKWIYCVWEFAETNTNVTLSCRILLCAKSMQSKSRYKGGSFSRKNLCQLIFSLTFTMTEWDVFVMNNYTFDSFVGKTFALCNYWIGSKWFFLPKSRTHCRFFFHPSEESSRYEKWWNLTLDLDGLWRYKISQNLVQECFSCRNFV